MVQVEDLRTLMETDNIEWLAAFNTGDVDRLGAKYAADATVVDPQQGPIQGVEAIKRFWSEGVKHVTDHTWEIVDVYQMGDLAYQIATWTAKSGGQIGAGNTVRIFERQADGRWLTKVHMFNEPAQ
jgi:ketosteroid isomerase-like protein